MRHFFRSMAAVAVLAGTAAVRADGIPSAAKLGEFQRQAETLRGLKFRTAVPVSTISEAELRALVSRELDKEYPGRKLADYQELMAWLDMLPPGTDLRKVYSDFLVDQAAGMYDTDTKRMYIPEMGGGKKKVEHKIDGSVGDVLDGIVYVHEYTHALEDQYWKLEDAADKDSQASTDRAAGRTFLAEGSATHLMVEAVPAQAAAKAPRLYVFIWNLMHSGVVDSAMSQILLASWKMADVQTPGVPETLARGEVMPYGYGYAFCNRLMHDWGLDGLDYACGHPPVSTEQAMHPEKCWEWRDFPAQVTLPETLPGNWTRRAADTAGEAGMAALFGCQLKDFSKGERIAAGWDGDRAALYERPDGGRFLIWASSWDSKLAAIRYADACVAERKAVHKAIVRKDYGSRVEWTRPDGRSGLLLRDGCRVILAETDRPEALAGALLTEITFTEPPEDAARAAANNAFLRFNPLLSWRRDGDYSVTKSAWGLLWRHDHNAVGSSDSVLWGLLGESRRTPSFNKWGLGWGWVATHESESRRNFTETGLLPWGVLWSHFAAALPQDNANIIRRDSCAWGLAGSYTRSLDSSHLRLLPGGLLFRCDTGPKAVSVHLVGTGVSRTAEKTRFRILGIPVYTRRAATPEPAA